MNKDFIARTLMLLGAVMLILAQVSSIGYGIYLWGGQGVNLGLAVWTAFKLWVVLMVTGVLFLAMGRTVGES